MSSPSLSATKHLLVALTIAAIALPGRAEDTPAPAADETAGVATPAVTAPEAPKHGQAKVPEDRAQQLTTCSLPQEEEFFGFEWARRASYRSVCLASHWLDGLFGENDFDPTEGQINGYVALISDKRQGGKWETTPRIRASVKLPQASKKLDLFFDRDKESQSIAGESAALHPEANTRNEESTNQIGIGYQLHQGVADLLNVRVGLRVRSWKPELFARSRYAVTFADTAVDRWNFDQTLFWKKNEGFGETSSLEYQRHLGGPFIFRWQNSATFSETSDGMRWSSALSIFHALDDDKAMQWSYGANGETGQVEKLANFGPRVSYRQRLKQRWLFVELYTGVDHVKNESTPSRQTQTYVGARIEAHFNPP